MLILIMAGRAVLQMLVSMGYRKVSELSLSGLLSKRETVATYVEDVNIYILI